MKLFYWNCRGMGNANTQRTFASFCRQYSPDYVCLVEPLVIFSSVSSSFWDRLDLTFMASNSLSLPSIWVLRKRSAPSPVSLHVHEQHITVDIPFANALHRISFIYGSIWRNHRLSLWTFSLFLRH